MSQEIRHFIVFVEPDRTLGQPIPDEILQLGLGVTPGDRLSARLAEGVRSQVETGALGGAEVAPQADLA